MKEREKIEFFTLLNFSIAKASKFRELLIKVPRYLILSVSVKLSIEKKVLFLKNRLTKRDSMRLQGVKIFIAEFGAFIE